MDEVYNQVIETIYDDPQSFLSELNTLENEGYYFRGVEKRSFLAQSSAFRFNKMKENRNKFPTTYSQVVTDWFYHSDIIQMIQPYYKITDYGIKHHPSIRRLFDLLSYLQVCNYLFTKYKEENPNHVLSTDVQQMKNRDSNFWVEQKTFNYMVESYFPKILTREALDKSWRQDGYIDNIVTAIDMSFPQHYGESTSALDFTKKILNAIYFAIESHFNIRFDSSCGLYLTEQDVSYSGYLSIYALKLTRDYQSFPILLEEIDPSIPNLRAKNQQGVLCQFSKPCSFYMEYGRFPTIEDYLIDGKSEYFLFKKVSLRRSVSNLDYLGKILTKENITKSFIYPN